MTTGRHDKQGRRIDANDVGAALKVNQRGEGGLLSLRKDDAEVSSVGANGDAVFANLSASGSEIDMSGLPTSDPGVAGRLWNDSGTLKVSSG